MTMESENKWELTLREVDSNGIPSRRVIWQSAKDAWPSSQHLSDILDLEIDPKVLVDLSAQVVRNAPVEAISGILTCLICTYWRDETKHKRSDTSNNKPPINVRMLQAIASSSKKSICGQVFKKGDIVWTCRQCAKDTSCVQCDACFRKSDHQGHEVYFHRASGNSGCCDCGDAEAWAVSGNCLDHSHPSDAEKTENTNPADQLPEELVKGLRAVLQGVLGVAVSFSACCVRGFGVWDLNPFVQRELDQMDITGESKQVLIGRLHNDDVHTYDQVISALQSINIGRSTAETLTSQVDKMGEAIIGKGTINQCNWQDLSRNLQKNAKLLFSIVPEEVFLLDSHVGSTFSWMQSMGMLSEGIRRIITEELLTNLVSLPTNADPSQGKFSPLSLHHLANAYIQDPNCSAVNLFDDEEQFPCTMAQLKEPPIGAFGLPAPVFKSTSVEQEQGTGVYERDFNARLMHPLDHCARNAFSVLLLASPFLSVPMKKAINDIVMYFQHDALFKSGFSQLFTVLYPTLKVLYCRHFGTADHTIFHTSVQVYTAYSVVSLMSSQGLRNRCLPEGPRPIQITTLLSATLMAVLWDTGCRYSLNAELQGTSDALTTERNHFLLHHSIRTHRLSNLCRDMEYLTVESDFCVQLLCENIDPGTIDVWIEICTMLQAIDSQKRRVRTHVEMDDEHWQDAANLVLEIESVSNVFISHALYPPPTTQTDAAFADKRFSVGGGADPPVVTSLLDVVPIEGSVKSQVPPMDSFTQGVVTCVKKILTRLKSAYDVSGVLGYPLRARSVCIFDEKVSVHLPLHRFLTKIVTYAAYSNASLRALLDSLCETDEHTRGAFADPPLRSLSFAAQVSSGMWRRNGFAAANLSFNYSRSPLSKILRDMDILAVQLSVFSLKPDNLLSLSLDMFELPPVLSRFEWSAPYDINYVREYQGSMLSELLKLFIHIITYLPIGLNVSTGDSPSAVEGWRRALSRELVHHVLSGSTSVGSLQRVKVMVGSNRTVSDVMLEMVIDDLCDRKVSDEGDSRMLQLKPVAYSLYDPEFPNLSAQQAATAGDRYRNNLSQTQGDASTPGQPLSHPLLRKEALPIAHRDFEPVRLMLYRPGFFTLLEKALRLCLDSSSVGTSRLTILGRVVHLVTLQIHCCKAMDVSRLGLDPHNWTDGQRYFEDAFKPLAEDAAFGSHGVAGCGVALLEALAEVWTREDLKDDKLYQQGLAWILREIAGKSEDGRAMMLTKGISFEPSDPGAADAANEDKAARKRAAQLKAIQEAKVRAQAFAAFADEMSDSDEEEDDDDDSPDGSNKAKKEKEPECIICHEKKSSDLGYLCLIQPSNLLKNVLLQNPDSPPLGLVYRVVCTAGVAVYSSPSEVNGKLITVVPYNEHVLMKTGTVNDGRWLELTAPVAGWSALYCKTSHSVRVLHPTSKVFDAGEEKERRRESAGKMSSRSGSYDGDSGKKTQLTLTGGAANVPGDGTDLLAQLCPVTELMFNQHGGCRLQVTPCGHTMHYDCWDLFFSSNYARYINGHRSADQMAVNIDKGESLCPLCKGVTNSLLPFTSLSAAQKTFSPQPGCSDAGKVSGDGSMAEGLRMSDFSSCQGYFSSLLQQNKADANHPSSVPTASVAFGEDFIISPEVSESTAKVMASLLELNSSEALKERAASFGDRMFNDSCSQLYLQPWVDTTSGDYQAILSALERSNPSFKPFRQLHTACATGSYSLLSSTCRNIKARGISSGSHVPIELSDLEKQSLHHTLSLARRAVDWFPSVTHFNDSVVNAFSSLLFGLDSPGSKTGGTLDRVTECSSKLPCESIQSIVYPDTLTQLKIRQSGEPKLECLWPVLQQPLLSQDLGMLNFAIAATARSFEAFQELNSLLCLVKILQLLSEPVCTGAIDFFGLANRQHEKASDCGPLTLTDGEERSSSDRKRKISDASSSETDSTEIDEFGALLEVLRSQICGLAGIKVFSAPTDDGSCAAPTGKNLVSLVVDGLVPFLESSTHLTAAVGTLAGSSSVEDNYPVEVRVEGVDLGLQTDATHQSLVSKFMHVGQLLRVLKVPSIKEVTKLSNFQKLLEIWGTQLSQQQKTSENSTSPKFIPHKSKSASAKDLTPTADKSQDLMDVNDLFAGFSRPTHQDQEEEPNSGQGEGLGFFSPTMTDDMDDLVIDEDDLMVVEEVSEHDDQSDNDADQNQRNSNSDSGNDSNGLSNGGSNSRSDHYHSLEDQEMSMSGSASDDGAQSNEAPATDPQGLQLFPILGSLDVSRHGSIDNGSGNPAPPWRLVGIYPVFFSIDEDAGSPDFLLDEGEKDGEGGIVPWRKSRLNKPPLQSSFAGTATIVNIHGQKLRWGYPDLSHLSVGLRHLKRVFIHLPYLYTDLYQMAKFPEGQNQLIIDDPAICLICGRVVNAGNRMKEGREAETNPGECTLHSRSCGVGIGVFFLVQHCNILLIRGSRAVYYPSIYLDSSGEVNENRGQNKPLFLSVKRYQKLEELYINHQIAKEICRKRSTADAVIRQNWY